MVEKNEDQGRLFEDDPRCERCGRELDANGKCPWHGIADEPAKRHHHPNIGGSKQGAHDVAFRAGTQKARLLEAYAQHADLTGAEAAGHAGIALSSAYWMRCSELRAQGLIEEVLDDAGNTVLRDGPMGSPQMVSRITDRGLATHRSMKESNGHHVNRSGPVPPIQSDPPGGSS